MEKGYLDVVTNKEIIEIYFEEQPEKYEDLLLETLSFSIIRIEKQ